MRAALLLAALGSGCTLLYPVEPLQGGDAGRAIDSGSSAGDAGPTEAMDSGPPADAAALDGGGDDGGLVDAGPRDAGGVDAGEVDAAVGGDPALVVTTPGVMTYLVPDGVTLLTIRAWGGGGEGGSAGGATGGGGGFVQADLPVTPGETLILEVGEGGEIGGALGDGGGATSVQRGAVYLVVAGGGGGGGSDGGGMASGGAAGGGGGGIAAENGGDGIPGSGILERCPSVLGGEGGQADRGGAGGRATGRADLLVCDGTDGARERGGRGTSTGLNSDGTCDTGFGADGWESGGGGSNGGGGGGGAGFYGGGAGGHVITTCGAGGGGGSSYTDASAMRVIHEAGRGPIQGRASMSMGAGAGGSRCDTSPCAVATGADGRLELFVDASRP